MMISVYPSFFFASIHFDERGENAGLPLGALPQVRETRIIAYGSLRFPISTALNPAQRARGSDSPAGNIVPCTLSSLRGGFNKLRHTTHTRRSKKKRFRRAKNNRFPRISFQVLGMIGFEELRRKPQTRSLCPSAAGFAIVMIAHPPGNSRAGRDAENTPPLFHKRRVALSAGHAALCLCLLSAGCLFSNHQMIFMNIFHL